MTNQDTGSVASALLRAWSTGDFERTRALLHENVEFVGPLGTTRGADAYVEGIRGMAKIVDRTEPQRVVADGEHVVILYDLVTKQAGRLPTAGYYHVRDGKIDAVRAYFDPRPLEPHH